MPTTPILFQMNRLTGALHQEDKRASSLVNGELSHCQWSKSYVRSSGFMPRVAAVIQYSWEYTSYSVGTKDRYDIKRCAVAQLRLFSLTFICIRCADVCTRLTRYWTKTSPFVSPLSFPTSVQYFDKQEVRMSVPDVFESSALPLLNNTIQVSIVLASEFWFSSWQNTNRLA